MEENRVHKLLDLVYCFKSISDCFYIASMTIDNEQACSIEF